MAGQVCSDFVEYGICCIQNLVICESQQGQPFLFKAFLPSLIVFNSLWQIVNWPVYFNNETRITAIEVDNEAIDWMLAAKTEALYPPAAKALPQAAFGRRRILAHMQRKRFDVSVDFAVSVR